MSVTPAYRDFVLEQLGRSFPLTTKSMFGGLGLYTGGVFFAFVDDDLLYFKVGDSNRADYEAAGSEPFRPYNDERTSGYWVVPADVLEDPGELAVWAGRALEVARAKKSTKKASTKVTKKLSPKPSKSGSEKRSKKGR
jgi:DNA transformation protein and related proteins